MSTLHWTLHTLLFQDGAATPAPTRGQIIGNMGRLLMEHKDAIVALENP